MTQEFAKKTNLLAKDLNFPENAAILSVGINNGEKLDITTTFSGSDACVDALIEVILKENIKYTREHTGTDLAKAKVEAFKECLDKALKEESEGNYDN